MLQLKVCLQQYCFGRAINLQRDLKLIRNKSVGLEERCRVTSKTDSFTKAVLERYWDKTKILYIKSKEEEILGLFLAKKSLIFQNCMQEIPDMERQNGTLSLMHQSQKT